MISLETLKRLSIKYQTSEFNVVREYCQHLFLSYFYQKKETEKILFKGGTALRLIYGSPRFSEDLDFSGFNIFNFAIEKLVEDTLVDIEREGTEVEIKEATKTSGGYLSIIGFKLLEYSVDVQLEISLRQKDKLEGMAILINSDFIPAYALLQLPEEALVDEKIQALLSREKPRDFYDLYFILRSRLSVPNRYLSRHNLKEKVKTIMEKEDIDFKRELKIFLPVSQHQLLPNFEQLLNNEVNRYL